MEKRDDIEIRSNLAIIAESFNGHIISKERF